MRIKLLLFLFILASYSFAIDYKITVATEGKGHVSSYPSGILCGAACAESYSSGREMTLTATPDEGSSFVSWSGACSGTQTTCTFVINSDKSVTAKFSGQSSTTYLLTVYRTGSGSGSLTSNPAGIYLLGSISPYDSNKFAADSNVVLTATPNAGSKFTGWSGSCTGTGTCTVTMGSQKEATATFSLEAEKTYTLKVEKTGEGSGTVSTDDKKIDCGSACLQYFSDGTSVTLTATPSADSIRGGWLNCTVTVSANTCKVTFNSDKKVTAKFDKAPSKPTPTLTPASTPAPTPTLTPSLTQSTPVPTPMKQEDQSGDYPLEIKQPGSVGNVKSDDTRIDCGSACKAGYRNGAQVTLTATPLKGYGFSRWEGACLSDTTGKCTVTIEGSRFAVSTTTVRAVFVAAPNTVKVSTIGDGIVKSMIYGSYDYRINCGAYCAASYKTGQSVSLEAVPGKDSSFEGWEGDCSGTGTTCTLDTYGITSDKSVTAKFKGPPPPTTLSLYMKGGSAKADVSILEGVKRIDKKTCESDCTLKFKHGVSVEILLTLNNRSYFQGFTGDCIGRVGNCYLTMNTNKTVILDFTGWRYHKLTVAKPQEGVVVSTAGQIECGEKSDKCTAVHAWLDYARSASVRFKDDDGEFLSGCDTIYSWGADRTTQCVVVMNSDKHIVPGMSGSQQRRIIKQALTEIFASDDYPWLQPYVVNETNWPFRSTFFAFHEKKAGRSVESIKNYINAHIDDYLGGGGHIQYMKDSWDKKIAKDVLVEVFAPEIAKTPQVKGYALDEGKKPFQHALADLKEKRNGGRFEGLKSWIQQNKDWYLSFTGINDLIESLKPKPSPTPVPVPSITSISPEGGQIGKPVVIKGNNFINVREVRITYESGSYDLLDYNAATSETKIILPRVEWGMRYDGTVTVYTDGGSAWAPIIYPNGESVVYNANGKKEECFGGVGKGCGGLLGMDWSAWGSQAFAAKAGCTEPLKQGDINFRNCWVAVGSIKHDNCCVRHPSGQYCGGPGTDGKEAGDKNHDGHCVAEWSAATSDVFWGRPWHQAFPIGADVDLTPGGTRNNRYPDGEAVTTLRLCAPRGHELRQREDAPFCCSGEMDNNKKCT